MILNINRRLAAVLSLLIGSMIVVACGGGSSSSAGGGNAGASNVVGNITTFNSASFTPESADNNLLAHLGKWLLPAPAQAVSGVTVSIAGATTVTQGDGSFAISGLPAGDQVITFSQDSRSASITVDLPPNATLVLANIIVNDDQVSVGNTSVADDDDSSSFDDGNANIAGNVNDDLSSDDGGSSDDSVSSVDDDSISVDRSGSNPDQG